MMDFYVMAYSSNLKRALELYKELSDNGAKENVELWEIERDKYGNRYAIIFHQKMRGRPPCVKLLKKLKP